MPSSRRSSRLGPIAIALAAVALTLVGAAVVSAHRLDECLQAARISVGLDGVGVDLDVTPGVAVAEAVIRTIDRDGDGTLSPREQAAYTADVVNALEITLDGEPLPLRVIGSSFPELAALRRGEDAIRLRASTQHPGVSGGRHQIVFRQAPLAEQSTYLANALVPESTRVSVTRQRRDAAQRELTIDYDVRASRAVVTASWLAVSLALGAVLVVRFRRRAALPDLP